VNFENYTSFRELFTVNNLSRQPQRSVETVEVDPNAPKVFGNTANALNFFDTKQLNPIPTSYWAAMERRKTEITQQSMGPENAFEEQIQWTEQGRMWPYPIDNEYLMGAEENVSFNALY
jgi:small subunit ribosomal protein S31